MNRNKIVWIYILMATVFWFEMFYLKNFNFWIEMAIAASILAGSSLLINPKDINHRLYSFKFIHIAIGIITAAILYFIFFAGDYISNIILPFADKQVTGIYDNKSILDPKIIALLLFFLIGPAEEVFWRGFVQDTFQVKFGENKGWLIASFIYAAVHIFAFNFMLFMAALICGLFWGWMFKKYKSLWPGIISHALWDVFIFIFIPVR